MDIPEQRTPRDGGYLVMSKTGSTYDVHVTGGAQLTERELGAIGAFVGNDPDGADLLAALHITASV